MFCVTVVTLRKSNNAILNFMCGTWSVETESGGECKIASAIGWNRSGIFIAVVLGDPVAPPHPHNFHSYNIKHQL
jgi:hypothetical protein